MLSTDRHPLNSFQPTSQAQGIFSPLLDFFQHFGFNCALFNSKKHWLINNSSVSRTVSLGKVEPLVSPCKLSRAGNTTELSSHHSQRALGDKQTLSLSGILITTTGGREKGCARKGKHIYLLPACRDQREHVVDDGGGDQSAAHVTRCRDHFWENSSEITAFSSHGQGNQEGENKRITSLPLAC